MYNYRLGNPLRGWYLGKYKNDEDAWNELSERFRKGFPTDNGKGRLIYMWKCVSEGNSNQQYKEVADGKD